MLKECEQKTGDKKEAAAQLKDPVLREQATQLMNSNQQLFNRFFNLV